MYKIEDDWVNYLKGVMEIFKKYGYDFFFGFDILFFGNIFNGVGFLLLVLIELVICVFLNKIFELNIDMMDFVKMV